MGDNTSIQWTDHTWNPWQGCTKVSAGCRNCYMYSEKARYGQDPFKVVRSEPPTFNRPLSKLANAGEARSKYKWQPGERVFTCSWSDFFHEDADPWRQDALDIIERRSDLTFQVLTKRPERIGHLAMPNNVWLGVSTEDQAALDKRWGDLKAAQARVKFLSVEPMLGPIVLPGTASDVLDWVIIGGESGHGARRFDVEWARELLMQCRLHAIPVFVKQLGAHTTRTDERFDDGADSVVTRVQLRDRKGGDWAEWPDDLRVREFPA